MQRNFALQIQVHDSSSIISTFASPLRRDHRHALVARRERSEAGEKFSDAPRLSAPRPATINPFSPATMSPLRSVGSFSMLTGARPIWSLPLQVHPATNSLR